MSLFVARFQKCEISGHQTVELCQAPVFIQISSHMRAVVMVGKQKMFFLNTFSLKLLVILAHFFKCYKQRVATSLLGNFSTGDQTCCWLQSFSSSN